MPKLCQCVSAYSISYVYTFYTDRFIVVYRLVYYADISVAQSVHDGSKFRPVVGGFESGKITKKGCFEQQFNLAGEYTFTACVVVALFAEFTLINMKFIEFICCV